jgi:hypothetical protein
MKPGAWSHEGAKSQAARERDVLAISMMGTWSRLAGARPAARSIRRDVAILDADTWREMAHTVADILMSATSIRVVCRVRRGWK